jgi:hypothetical protein
MDLSRPLTAFDLDVTIRTYGPFEGKLTSIPDNCPFNLDVTGQLSGCQRLEC